MFPPIYLSQFTVKLGKLAATSVDAIDYSNNASEFENRRLTQYLSLTPRLPFKPVIVRLVFSGRFEWANRYNGGDAQRARQSERL